MIVVGRRPGACCASPWPCTSASRARGPARLPARVRRARAREGLRDRQERARPGAGEGRRRARQRQLAARAHQRDRGARSAALPAFGVQQLFGADWSLRFAAVVFVDRDDPRDPDPADATARARRRAARSSSNGAEMHTAEHPARGSAMAVLRGSVGFLAFFAAFSLKDDLVRAGRRAGARPRVGGFVGVIAAPVAAPLDARGGDRRVVARAPGCLHAARCAGRRHGRASCSPRSRSGSAPRPGGSGSTACCSATVPTPCAGARSREFETRFQLVWVIGGMIAIIPFAKQMGLFLLAVVLGFAAVSYVAALRAARGRVMRTKLLPEAVDRTISRSRDQAVDRVKRRFRKPGAADRRPTGRRALRRLLIPAAGRALHHAEGADRPAEAVDHQRVDLLAGGDALVDARGSPPGSSPSTRGWRRSPTRRSCASLITTGFLPHAVGDVDDRLHGRVARVGGAHDLGEAHHHRRRRPVPADHELGTRR